MSTLEIDLAISFQLTGMRAVNPTSQSTTGTGTSRPPALPATGRPQPSSTIPNAPNAGAGTTNATSANTGSTNLAPAVARPNATPVQTVFQSRPSQLAPSSLPTPQSSAPALSVPLNTPQPTGDEISIDNEQPVRLLDPGPAPLYRLHAYPGTSFQAGYLDQSLNTQNAVINIVNASHYLPEDMSLKVLSGLAEAITPESPFYVTHYCGSVIREFQRHMKGIFVWVKASDLDIVNDDGGIPPYARFRTMDLAKALLEFVKPQPSNDPVDMTSICFKYFLGGVMGVMFFGEDFKEPFQDALVRAQSRAIGTDMYDEHPVTFYPLGALINSTRYVYIPDHMCLAHQHSLGLCTPRADRLRTPLSDISNEV
ncbi:hypothetical protein FA13DRAFT_1735338 [Coprinellus micaceus]|uniref:Uncharacterized protein n=1 Tax=Coprinellus micaceus TaxID=71717 RepID=A0A4Y7T3W0_COPMI|nr:hypothetical protein FA13DRAFT_1735338 [Coprinellus micaceus]